MTKLTKQEVKRLISDYETNKYSQRALAKKYNISVGTVSKHTKDVVAKNEHFVNAQITMYTALSTLTDEQMNAIMNTAKDEAICLGLATNATQMNLIRINELLASNKKLEKRNAGDGIQVFEEVALGSSDFKHIQDAIDKSTITMGINKRHANNQVTVNTQNNNTQQIEMTETTVKQVLADFDNNY